MKFKLMEGKALAKLIGSIGVARTKLDGEVQVAAVQCIGQSIVHRNTTPANSLLEAVSKHHKATLVAYVEKFGNFQWERKAERLEFREVYKSDQLEMAMEKIGDAKWHDAKKPPKVVSQYDGMVMLEDFFDRWFKLTKKEGITVVNKPVVEAAYAAYCEQVVRAYGEGDKSKEQKAVDLALEARNKGLATPAQLQMLAEHYGKPITQHEETPSAKQQAAVEEARAQFGARPELASVAA